METTMGNTEGKIQEAETETGSQQLAKVKTTLDNDSPAVDLCFMLDCTGSMSAYILMSCNKIKDIIKQVNEIYPKSEIRIGIVAYRDHGDRGQHEVFHFLPSADKAKQFLDKLQASGGGDTPEDINGAFQQVIKKMDWQSPVRILIHIADAPCHGKEFHTCDDTYPKGHKSDMSWDEIFMRLVELRLDYLFLKISNITDKMFEKFKQFANKHGAEENELSFTQELANQSNALNSEGKGKGAKTEDHFAATITHAVKTGVAKEMKKGLANKLAKRVEENAELVNKIKASVAETAKKIDIEALKEKYSDLASKVGDCILSSNNFIDAIADEDCLCLTFDIGRSQAAVVDPSQIIIKNVYPSFLTAGSFFYSTEYALKKNKLAHGGFEKHAEGLILKGAASENITGVMPLYFCEENWSIAKQLMKLTIAWDVTLDPLGYSYSQIKTVPFLILAKLAEMMHEKPNNEFLKFQFDLVKKTCEQIMKDGSKEGFENKFNVEVFNLYTKYLEDTSVRTIDSIANNSIFLAQLYIAKEIDGLPTKEEGYFDEIFKALLEEELRRRQRNHPEDFNPRDWLFKMLNVDVEKYISEPVRALINSQSNKKGEVCVYEEKFLQVLGAMKGLAPEKVEKTESKEESKEETKTEETKTEDDPLKGDPRSTELTIYNQSFTTAGAYNDIQIKAREDYNKTLEFVMKYLYPLRKLFTNEDVKNPSDFIEWGIKDDAQFFTLLIQNKLQGKNAGRREAFANKTYKNPWTQAEEYIQTWYNKLIEEEKSRRINEFLTGIKEAKSAQQANTFAMTENLNEAAGALLGACIGADVMDFFNSLCIGGVPLATEKIKMMMSGHYKGVKLYKDAENWIPCRRNSNRLLLGNSGLFTVDEWVKLMPKLSRTYTTVIRGT